jgi:hypothetical protein
VTAAASAALDQTRNRTFRHSTVCGNDDIGLRHRSASIAAQAGV